jgi:hypothetical protein
VPEERARSVKVSSRMGTIKYFLNMWAFTGFSMIKIIMIDKWCLYLMNYLFRFFKTEEINSNLQSIEKTER